MNKNEADQIASAIAAIRPEWLQSSLVTTLGRLPAIYRDRPARDVHLALAWLAYDPQQQTPRLLREPGPWWDLGRPPVQRPAEVIPLTCEHGQRPARCAQCAHPTRALPTPEQHAKMRADIAATKTALKAQEIR